MATLAAISFTLVGGLAFFGLSLGAFGCALKSQSPFIAARCIARPKNVIYNPNIKTRHPCQNRGNPTLGWIMWVMRLSYGTMLRGVPGTGTRDGGLSGALLKVNLDGIVMLRFHHLCLRVSFLAVLLYLVIVLPLYKTAQCSRSEINHLEEQLYEQAQIQQQNFLNYDTNQELLQDWLGCKFSNLTDYQRLTLANIPILDPPPSQHFSDIFKSFFLPVHDGLLARLYAVVFCAWIVCWYSLRELQYEWSEVLAMRRVYYLEADHWADRNEELQETLLREEQEKLKRQKKAFHFLKNQHNNNNNNNNKSNKETTRKSTTAKTTAIKDAFECDSSSSSGSSDGGGDESEEHNDDDNESESGSDDDDEEQDDDMYMKNREPWIPHPEQRDTVPSVELYSILVGGLPSLPTEVINNNRRQNIEVGGGEEGEEMDEVLFSRKQSIDFQLTVTTAFFDHCVPNQPGFSSSVAAVTILPAADQLTEAWNHWYNAAAKLRRLRFIRKQIAKKRRQEQQRRRRRQQPQQTQYRVDDSGDDESYEEGDIEQPVDYTATKKKRRRIRRPRRKNKNKNKPKTKPNQIDASQKGLVYSDSKEKQEYYQEVLGSNTDLDVERNLLNALDFGPEQTAVYSREFALGAASIAPNGWFEDRIRDSSLDVLLEMEKEAVKAFHEANQDLKLAQGKIADDHSVTAHGDKNGNGDDRCSDDDGALSDDDLEQIMMNSTCSIGSGHLSCIGGSSRGLRNIDDDLDSDSIKSDLGEMDTHVVPLKTSPTASTPQRNGNNNNDDDDKNHEDGPSGRPKRTGSFIGLFSRSSSSRSLSRSNHSSADSFAEMSSDEDIEQGDKSSSGKRFSMENLNRLASFGSGNGNGNGTNNSNNGGNTPGTPKFSISDVGKQMSMQLMPMVSNLSNKKPARRARRGDISNTQLPSDLGLEAGLFMEQRNLSLDCGSQHFSRRQIRRGKSGDNLSSMRRRRPPTRTRSEEDFEDYSAELSKPSPRSRMSKARVRRARSFDDLLEIAADDDNDDGDANDGEENISLSKMRESIKNNLTLDVIKSPSRMTATDSQTDEASRLSTKSHGSIWDRLEKDEQRKSRLRKKLDSMQNLQNTISNDTPSTESGNSGSTGDDLGSGLPQSGMFSLKKDEPPVHQSTRQKDASNKRFASASADREHPLLRPRRSWRAEESDECQKRDTQTRPVDGPQQTSGTSRGHRKTSSFDANMVSGFIAGNHNNMMSAIDENDSVSKASKGPPPAPYHPHHHQFDLDNSRRSASSHTIMDENLRFEEDAGIRDAGADEGPRRRVNKTKGTDKWAKVVSIVRDDDKHGGGKKGRKIASGKWKVLSPSQIVWKFRRHITRILTKSTDLLFNKPEVIDELAKHSSYAVVTFTSRQAALAARHCLADSRGTDRWVTVGELPSPPLADAPAFNMLAFRGMTRPVTLSISDKQKLLRHNLALAALATIYFFYTIPLTAAQQLVSPETLSRAIPDILEWQENSLFVANIFSGLIPALVWTGFFAICPPLFKIISNFGSNATSSALAETSALNYFWWFMVVSAFTGTSLATAIVNGFDEGIALGAQLQGVIEKTASTIPTEVSATWLNWMILRVTIVLPTQYLLQLNTFLFSFFGLKPCSRTVRGGGPGGPIPYRLYVDSGVVMLCLFALAPASPLIAPAVFLYFLFCTPMLRWTLIFLYKPKFDIGGQRFPFMFDMCISGMIVGQILLVAMMTLKRAIGPAIVAFCPMIPTLIYRYVLRRRYLRAFNDAALLQTSLLDGWDTNEETSEAKREEFRKFLVDCHKAAYVPVCIASSDTTTSITVEPAIVVATEADEEFTEGEFHYMESGEPVVGGQSLPRKAGPSFPSTTGQQHQHGVFARRAQPGHLARRQSVSERGYDLSVSERDHDLSVSERDHDLSVSERGHDFYSPPKPGQMLRRVAAGHQSPIKGTQKLGRGDFNLDLFQKDLSFRSNLAKIAAAQRHVDAHGNGQVSPLGSPFSSPMRSMRNRPKGLPL